MKEYLAEMIAKGLMLSETALENFNCALHDMYIKDNEHESLAIELNQLTALLGNINNRFTQVMDKNQLKDLKKSKEELLNKVWQ
jgi:hypothetical protein